MPEDDAFERAAAQLRPEWEDGEPSVVPPPPPAPPRAHIEPTVIVQSDMSLIAQVADAEPDLPQSNASAVVRTGFPTASRARHEATVVTRPPPSGLATLRPPTIEQFGGDELALAQAERTRKMRIAAIGAGACVLLGVLIALVTGRSPEPIAPPPPAAVAPVVQPLPAVIPAVTPAVAPGTSRSKSDARTSAAKPAPTATKPQANVRAPLAKKKPAPVARPAAKPPVAKVAPKAPIKAAPKAKVAPKGAASKAPPVDASKRARSPIDALNPWGS